MEGTGLVLRRRRQRTAIGARGLDLPRAQAGLFAAPGPYRLLRGKGRGRLPRRRAGNSAGRRLLRWLGDRGDRGAVQGRSRQRGLVGGGLTYSSPPIDHMLRQEM